METCTIQRSPLSNVLVQVKTECECDVSKPSENGSMVSNGTYMKCKVTEQETSDDFDDSLDNIVLRERRKMLFARLLVPSADPLVEANPKMTSKLSLEDVQQSSLTGSEDTNSVSCKQLTSDDFHHRMVDSDPYQAANASKSEMTGTYSTIFKQLSPASPDGLHNTESTASRTSAVCDNKSYDSQDPLTRYGLSAHSKVKAEQLDPDEFKEDGKSVQGCFATAGRVSLKNEMRNFKDIGQDVLNHSLLMDKTKLIPSGTSTSMVGGVQKHLTRYVLKSFEPTRLETEESGASHFVDKNPGDGWENLTSTHQAAGAFLTLSRVKLEAMKNSSLDHGDSTGVDKYSSHHMLPVKAKPKYFQEVSEDELDHMSLVDRIKLLSSDTSSPIHGSNLKRHLDLGHNVSESVESVNVRLQQKRRKTATCSAQTALEEDAPELLKVLVEKGIPTEGMKLYEASSGSEEAIDDAFCDFSELEAVISRVFAHHQPLLKPGSLRCSSGSKIAYCVGCLLSLVEQAQFLRSRKLPAEWGWSRDLQAFIFVFQKHNRIVLERPEYGYATYFFELLDSLPVGWQIRRLVIAMKLSNGRRITVLENKPLIIGEDITEGEARVLEQYGWIPNTGVGTMLNYCDRVIHDIKNERNGAEWKSKITKLLINGYNSGVIVPSFLQEKIKEEEGGEDTVVDPYKVKLEL